MYPRPQQAGGTLIRLVKKQIEPMKFFIDKDQVIFVACSGGPDSVALLHLLVKYGRNVVPANRIKVLHVNHHLRGEESDNDQAFVEAISKEFGVPCFVEHVKCEMRGRSEEDSAREQRLAVFERYPLTFTAHHKDDVLETLLWRHFTGAPAVMSQNGGILLQYKNQIRPFLSCWREDILEYLAEEKQSYCVDHTNLGGKLLRSKIRMHLVPALDEVFPGWKNKIL